MSNYYEKSRGFVKELDEEGIPRIEIAKFCGVSWQVIHAILATDVYDMGTVNHRKILAKKIEYDRHKKQQADWELINSLSEGNGYKDGRVFGNGHRTNRIAAMKGL